MVARKPSKKAIDITGPGAVSTQIGSKPMIVGHKIAKDPTITGVEQTRNDTPAEKKVSRKPSKVIAPVSDDMKKDSNADTGTKETATVGSGNDTSDNGAAVKTDEADGKAADTVAAKLDPAAIAMERDERLRAIIESKKYKVSIKERSPLSLQKVLAVLLGLIVTGIVSMFVLIDTGAIDSDVNLPFRVFGTDESEQATPKAVAVPQVNNEAPDAVKETNEGIDTTVAAAVVFPEAWGDAAADALNAGFQKFSIADTHSVQVHSLSEPVLVDVSFQVESYCRYESGTWAPDATEFPPSQCPDGVRIEGDNMVYVFEFGALGAYAHKEVVEVNGSVVELVEYADFKTDFVDDDQSGAPVIREGVVDRIQSSLQVRTLELIQANTVQDSLVQ